MDLPTYTNIWRIEKRLYKLYDLRLPMPLPLVQIGVFAGVFVPWILLLKFAGVPFKTPWHVLYLVPPGVLTWMATRPVIEGKRLTELLMSQSRYISEPRTWCRLTPIREPREVVIVARVWRRPEAPLPVAAPERAAIKKSRRRARKAAPREATVPTAGTLLPGPALADAPQSLADYAAWQEAQQGAEAQAGVHEAAGVQAEAPPTNGRRGSRRRAAREAAKAARAAATTEDDVRVAGDPHALAAEEAGRGDVAPAQAGLGDGAPAGQGDGAPTASPVPAPRWRAPLPAAGAPVRGRTQETASGPAQSEGTQVRARAGEAPAPEWGAAGHGQVRGRAGGSPNGGHAGSGGEAANAASGHGVPARGSSGGVPGAAPRAEHEASSGGAPNGARRAESQPRSGQGAGAASTPGHGVPTGAAELGHHGEPATRPDIPVAGGAAGSTPVGPGRTTRPDIPMARPSGQDSEAVPPGGLGTEDDVKVAGERRVGPPPWRAASSSASPERAADGEPDTSEAADVTQAAGVVERREGKRRSRLPWRRSSRDIAHEDDVRTIEARDEDTPADDIEPPPATPELEVPPAQVAPDAPAGSGKRALVSGVWRPGTDAEFWKENEPSATIPAPVTRPDIPRQKGTPPPATRPDIPMVPGAFGSGDKEGNDWRPAKETRSEQPATAPSDQAAPAESTPNERAEAANAAQAGDTREAAAKGSRDEPVSEPREGAAQSRRDDTVRDVHEDAAQGSRDDTVRDPRAGAAQGPRDDAAEGSHGEAARDPRAGAQGAGDGAGHEVPEGVAQGPRDGAGRDVREGVAQGVRDGAGHEALDDAAQEPRDRAARDVRAAAAPGSRGEAGRDPRVGAAQGPRDGTVRDPRAGAAQGPRDGAGRDGREGAAQGARDGAEGGGQEVGGRAPRPWSQGLSKPPVRAASTDNLVWPPFPQGPPARPPQGTPVKPPPPQPRPPAVEPPAPPPREVRSGPQSPVRPRPLPPPPAAPPSEPAITPPGPEHEVSSGGLRRLIQAVGGGHGEADAEYEARLQQPFHGTRHIVVLGCTGGAGQTVTALMLGHTFAQHNGEPVVAIDVNPGPGALARRTRSETNETLTGLITRADQVTSLTAMRRYTSQAKSGLDVIAAGRNPLQALDDRDYALAIRTIDRFYSVTLLDAAAAVVARVLPYADQVVLVAPASSDAPRAVAMTFEWLDGHGYDELRSRAVTVINGVSRRSMDDVEQAEAVARGRCRALVRIPWDDHLSMDRAPRNELKSLRAPTRRAYLALAGVVAGGFGVMPERYQELEQEQEATR